MPRRPGTAQTRPKGPQRGPSKRDITSPSQFPRITSVPIAAASDFSLVSDFHGYRNKEDITNLPPGYLVVGSQNVLTTTSSRISVRKGYQIDGQRDTTVAPILGGYDWLMHIGQYRHLRSGNSKLQFRYKATAAGQSWSGHTFALNEVYWIDLLTGTSSDYFNFTTFWDDTNLQGTLLFVNGESNIKEWSGLVTTFASATANTITKQGTTTWTQEGAYVSGTRSVTINGTVYTYTGGEGTTTITGVVPDPTLATYAVGTVIFQTVKTTTNAAMTAIPATLANALIATLDNQVYVASLTNYDIYKSKLNTYTIYTVTNPHAPGDGFKFTVDERPVALIPQEETMYFSCGNDLWYKITSQLSADLTAESLKSERLKTGPNQAVQSQAMTWKSLNDVFFISNEPAMNSLGRVESILQTPQTSNISDPIKDDFLSYNFTDASGIYFNYFQYLAVPREGVVRVWNIEKQYWEAPLLIPASRFSIIDGELYFHSYQTPQTFKLFTGYNDDGHPIDARAIFSFQNYGTRSQTKMFEEFFTEGYISQNGTLTLGIQYEIDGCATVTSYPIVGSDSQIVCLRDSDASLGKTSLGKRGLGMSSVFTSDVLPPKMRGIKTFPPTDFYECQISYSSVESDFHWELLAFGPLLINSPYDSTSIKQ